MTMNGNKLAEVEQLQYICTETTNSTTHGTKKEIKKAKSGHEILQQTALR